MSKDFVGTLASATVILAAMLGVAFTLGDMQSEISAKGETMTVLRSDIRELRDGWTRHLEAHSHKKFGESVQ